MDKMDKDKNVVIEAKTVQAVFTPFAMAGISEDLYKASMSYKPDKRFPIANYFLYAASIEIGLKAAILSIDCSKVEKDDLKKLRHNLMKIVARYENVFGASIFSQNDREMISSVNGHYQNKGLGYFTLSVLASSLRAFEDFPELGGFSLVAKKVNNFIKERKYFIDSKTTDNTVGGLINFY